MCTGRSILAQQREEGLVLRRSVPGTAGSCAKSPKKRLRSSLERPVQQDSRNCAIDHPASSCAVRSVGHAKQEGRTVLDEPVRIPRHFDTFYAEHYPPVVALVYALNGSRWAAEDLAQEAFLRAHRNWEEIGRYDSPAGWIRTVAAGRHCHGK